MKIADINISILTILFLRSSWRIVRHNATQAINYQMVK